MKNTGKCTKCQGKDIYTDTAKMKHTDSRFVPTTKSSWSYLAIDVYLCLDCGYVEEFVNPDHLKDLKKIDKIRQNWKKVQAL